MDTQEKTIQRLQIQIILLSLFLLAGAAAWTWQIGQSANDLDHRLYHVSEDLKGLRENVRQLEAHHA